MVNNAKESFARLMNGAVSAGRLAGATVLVVKDSRELFFGSYGYADREKGLPMKRDAVFRMFSMTKPVTATAIMILVERGLIDLTDSVEWYLEGFKNGKVSVMKENGGYELCDVSRPVTIEDLMTMTSGVCYPGIEDAAHIAVDKCTQEWERKLRSYDRPGTVDFANALGRCPLAFQPGEHWMYGYSADILGAVVEVVSGMPFGEFLKKEIFDPLGMKDTGFAITPSMRARLTEVYEDNPGYVSSESLGCDSSMEAQSDTTADGDSSMEAQSDATADGDSSKEISERALGDSSGTGDMPVGNRNRIRPFKGMNLGLGDFPDRPIFESGGAGLLSTTDDYAKFAMMLAGYGTYKEPDSGKEIRILSPSAVKFMSTNQINEKQAETFNWGSLIGHGYGSLMRVLKDNAAQVTTGRPGEFGWDGWLGTYFVAIPELNATILFMRQQTNTGFDDITRKFRAIAYSLL